MSCQAHRGWQLKGSEMATDLAPSRVREAPAPVADRVRVSAMLVKSLERLELPVAGDPAQGGLATDLFSRSGKLYLTTRELFSLYEAIRTVSGVAKTGLRLGSNASCWLAQQYLLQPSLELSDTAYLLGYEDPTRLSGLFTAGRVSRRESGG